MADTAIPDKTALSIACALGASLLFSINDIVVKSFSETLPLHEVVLFRSLIGLFLTLMIFAPGLGLVQIFRTKRPFAHAFRGLCVVLSNFAFFAGIAALPLAENSAIFFIAPLMITAFSALILREHVGPRRWIALVVGLTGVLLIIKPGSVSFQWALILPILSAVAYAGLHTMTRSMGLHESAATMSVYIQLTFVLVCLLMGLCFGNGWMAGYGHPSLEFVFRPWSSPNQNDFLLFLLAGCCSAGGGYLISQAYRSSAAGLVAPFEYSALVLATFWGFTFWGEVPGMISGIGIILILFSGVFVSLRENALSLAPAARRASGRR